LKRKVQGSYGEKGKSTIPIREISARGGKVGVLVRARDVLTQRKEQ